MWFRPIRNNFALVLFAEKFLLACRGLVFSWGMEDCNQGAVLVCGQPYDRTGHTPRLGCLTCCVPVAERARAGGETVATVIRLEAGSETRLPAFYSCVPPILEGHYTAFVDNEGFCSK